MKYYAVRKGKEPGIYTDWESCQEQTIGFKGAEYKSFKTREEANDYLQGKEPENNNTHKNIILLKGKNKGNVFTDGSYNNNLEISSYGYIFINDQGTEKWFSGAIYDKYGSRNITGEIEAVKESIELAIHYNYSDIKIFHDLEGIAKWADSNSKYEAAKRITREYKSYIEEKRKIINIDFQHVKGHSGVKYNELADRLARYEIESLKPAIEDDYGFRSYRYKDYEISKILRKLETDIEDFFVDFERKGNHNVYWCYVGNEKVVIKKYNFESGNKLLIEKGTSSSLFPLIVTYFTDEIKINSIIYTLNANFGYNVRQDEVYKKLYELAPNLKRDNVKINSHVFRLIYQAIYNTIINFPDIEDSSFLIIPATRALEGHLKYVLSEKLHIQISKGNFRGQFQPCSQNPNAHCLVNKYKSQLPAKITNHLNDCYNLYLSVRHVISHFGDVDAGDTTFYNTEESKLKIYDIIQKITEYY